MEKVLKENQRIERSTGLPSFNISVKFGEIDDAANPVSTIPGLFREMAGKMGGTRVEDSIANICKRHNNILNTARVEQSGDTFEKALSNLTCLQSLHDLIYSTDESSNMGFLFEGFMSND